MLSLDPKTLGTAVIIAVSTVCLCLVMIVAGFVIYLILHDGATPAAMFNTLQSIAMTALAALAAIVGLHQAAGAIIARANAAASASPSAVPQAAGGQVIPASIPAPSDSPRSAPQGQFAPIQPVGVAQG